ncbi:DUF6153 family protein [Saxibacter everestensis]|uniref:DUF6153 family protein n=1 Tax=Saxibacter everestensis TaxID=2909229 RepID=A0ABY8QY00_9MICO|nr:DUF6153 family protein [Brevibacteriaceae bacterium ZFBP1038]
MQAAFSGRQRPRDVLAPVAWLFGIAALIVGVLAMHVWVGGHGHQAVATPGIPAAAPDSGSAGHHAAGSAAASGSGAESTSHCAGTGCGGHDVTVAAACILALVLLTLISVRKLPSAWLLPRHLRSLFRAPLPPTSRRRPPRSLAELSILRC